MERVEIERIKSSQNVEIIGFKQTVTNAIIGIFCETLETGPAGDSVWILFLKIKKLDIRRYYYYYVTKIHYIC